MSLSIEKAMSLAKAHEKKREFEQARQIYTSILGQFPNNGRAKKALEALGGGKQQGGQGIDLPQDEARKLIAFMQQGRPDLAVKAAEAIAAQHPSSAFLWDITAMANASLGRFAEAEACFRRVVEIKPDFAEAHNNLGNTLKEQGKLDDAADSYARAVSLKPDMSLAHNGLGVVLLEQGKLEEAEASFRQALELQPGYAEAHNNIGNVLKEQERPEEAIAEYSKALELRPDYAEAHNNIGTILQKEKRYEDAAERYQAALKIRPNFAEAHNNVGMMLQEQGKFAEAEESYSKALSIKPDNAEVFCNLGILYEQMGDGKKAINYFSHAVKLKPDYAKAHNYLGFILNLQAKTPMAIKSLRRAIELKPDYAEAYSNLGASLTRRTLFKEAVEYLHKAIELDPALIEAYSNLAQAYEELDKLDDAEACCRKAVEVNPGNAKAIIILGNVLVVVGKHAEAIECFERALEIEPRSIAAYFALSKLKKIDNDDLIFHKVMELFESNTLDTHEQININFILAKISHDMGDYDRAFSFFHEGNRIRKVFLNYDISIDRKKFDNIKESDLNDKSNGTFSLNILSNNRYTPIFILGMPRSGTSLVEQIVSSHSQVYGAGELRSLPWAVQEAIDSGIDDPRKKLELLRSFYMKRVEYFERDESYITDKMPYNFLHIDKIINAIPEAKIIHMVRDPRAVCWSNFRQLFSDAGNGNTHDIEDIAHYYVMYAELMDFWRERFPGGFYDLDYQRLTENQEEETRKLIEYLGLEWEDACLSFHKNKRVVRTASMFQARKKMYTGSSEEWRRYEAHLQPMIRILEDAGLI